jgi:hypothetical protein
MKNDWQVNQAKTMPGWLSDAPCTCLIVVQIRSAAIGISLKWRPGGAAMLR